MSPETAAYRRSLDLHPSVHSVLRWFDSDHLPADLQVVARPIADLAWEFAERIPADPELTVGLRCLLDAKDALVRATIAARVEVTP